MLLFTKTCFFLVFAILNFRLLLCQRIRRRACWRVFTDLVFVYFELNVVQWQSGVRWTTKIHLTRNQPWKYNSKLNYCLTESISLNFFVRSASHVIHTSFLLVSVIRNIAYNIYDAFSVNNLVSQMVSHGTLSFVSGWPYSTFLDSNISNQALAPQCQKYNTPILMH